MRVLVGCERSGRVREAFRARGHDAWSCDREPAEDGSPFHIQGDCIWFAENDKPWDLFIVHPPCQFLAGSGLHWNKRRPERQQDTERGIQFAIECITAAVPRVCMENPIGALSKAIRKPEQIIQPHQFGEDASKATCLWLNNLPKLKHTKHIKPRWVCCGQNITGLGKCPTCLGGHTPAPRWANQTDSGQNRLGPSPTRAMDRARTYQGIADAMAEQWGNLPKLTMKQALKLYEST